MISKRTFNERLNALPLDFQLIFLEDLEGTIDAHLIVMERASQREIEFASLCKSQKSKGHKKLTFPCTVNLAHSEHTTRAKAKVEEIRA